MKYLIKYKTYENKITTSGNYGNYYIIHIDGSFEKFEPIYGNRMFNIDHKFGGYINCNKEEVNLYINAIENIKKYNL